MTLHRTHEARTAHPEFSGGSGPMVTHTAAAALAVLRILTGFTFLWAFLDKTFGLHYATPAAKAWINGGSPTEGFLAHVSVGPFQSVFHSIAGTAFANVVFMLGLLGIGVALIAGVAIRAAAVSGVIMLAMMWLATFPIAQTSTDGVPTGSNNPFYDSHFATAIVLVVLAATYAGTTWGLGGRWAKLPFVHKHRWAL